MVKMKLRLFFSCLHERLLE